METIVINNKTFVIKKSDKFDNTCPNCLFNHNNNYPKSEYYCIMTKCYNFIIIREVNVIDKIRMWFNKKIHYGNK